MRMGNLWIMSCGAGKMVRSLSVDDVTESVANEFLDMLGIDYDARGMSSDSEAESPRERLLKQFEKEFCAFGDSVLNLDAAAEKMEVNGFARTGSGRFACSDDFDLSMAIQEAEKDYNRVTQSLRSRRNAKKLENLETETLMQEWGLNEKVFQNSPQATCGGFGSPIYVTPEEPSELPPLEEGLDPLIQIHGGGFLRSMNSSLFRSSRNGVKLIMQVSNPVVLPAMMGSGVMDILEFWASDDIVFSLSNVEIIDPHHRRRQGRPPKKTKVPSSSSDPSYPKTLRAASPTRLLLDKPWQWNKSVKLLQDLHFLLKKIGFCTKG